MEIRPNMAYDIPAPRALQYQNTAIVNNNYVYEIPEPPEEEEKAAESTEQNVTEDRLQASSTNTFSWFRLTITLLVILALALGIAALAFAVSYVHFSAENLQSAFRNITAVEDGLQDCNQKLQDVEVMLGHALKRIELLEQQQHALFEQLGFTSSPATTADMTTTEYPVVSSRLVTTDLLITENEQENPTELSDCGGPGWRRIAFLNMTDENQTCPTGLMETSYSIRSCGISEGRDCDSLTFPIDCSYDQVCGRALGYRYGHHRGFALYHFLEDATDYFDGLSITYGSSRQHIWTFASGRFNGTTGDGFTEYRCPCDPGNPYEAPPFVGDNYFCESAATMDDLDPNRFYSNNPLWDGSGCEGNNNTCCLYNNPPWFTRQLPSPTTDGIEVRLCSSQSLSNLALNLLEIFIR